MLGLDDHDLRVVYVETQVVGELAEQLVGWLSYTASTSISVNIRLGFDLAKLDRLRCRYLSLLVLKNTAAGMWLLKILRRRSLLNV